MEQFGRKKFNIRSQIQSALARFKHQLNSEWTFMPRRDVLSRMFYDLQNKILPVHGSDFSFDMGLTRLELLDYLALLPAPQQKEQSTGRKLVSIPVFYLDHYPQTSHGKCFKTYKGTAVEFRKEYENCEAQHKIREHHHPDGIGWNSDDFTTVECVFDVLNSMMRSVSPLNIFPKLREVLKSDKFSNLSVPGIYIAYLHLITRGVAGFTQLSQSATWRIKPFLQLQKDHYDFLNGVPSSYNIAGYRLETQIHQACICTEMKRLRKPRTTKLHDYTKFEPKMLYYYAWYWGVFQQMPPVMQARALAGYYDLIPEVHGSSTASRTTMLSGVVKNAIDEAQLPTLARETVKDFEKVGKSLIDEVRHTVHDERVEMIEEAKNILQNLVSDVKDTLNQTVQRAEVLVQGLQGKIEPISDFFSCFTGLMNSALSQFKSFMSNIPGADKIEISPELILESLKLYLIYINTESTIIKSVVAILFLKSLGLLDTAYKIILQMWEWLRPTIQENDNTEEGNSTAGVFDWIGQQPRNLISIVAGLFASMAQGFAISKSQFWDLTKYLGQHMKDFHFIGSGMAGIAKIYHYGIEIYHKLADWIKKNILGVTPESQQIAKDIQKLIMKIQYFSTEAGINAIRMSRATRDQAEKLYADWVTLTEKVRANERYRRMYMDLQRQQRNVKDIADLIVRLKAMSSFQPTMFHIQFVGRPGIGKSTLTKNVVTSLQRSLWPDDDDATFYSWNPSLDHCDGYAGQKIMVADDLFRINEPQHLTNLIGMITNTPVILSMANLVDKGIQLTSEILVSSTNTPYPMGKDILCTEALHRRRHLLVQVEMDEDVLDVSSGQFSKALFEKKYPGQDSQRFPHLKFNLLRPVPDQQGGATGLKEGVNEFEVFQQYAKKLKEANFKIGTHTGEIDPEFYFSDFNRPPDGIQLPCKGWSFEQLIANTVIRFHAFRGMESKYSPQRKFGHVEQCLAEIDLISDQQEDLPGFPELPTTSLVKMYLTEMQKPFGSADPIGRRVAQGIASAPELDDIDFDALMEEVLQSARSTGITLTEEQERAHAIMRRRNRVQTHPDLLNILKMKHIDGQSYIPIQSHYTIWHEEAPFPHDQDTEDFKKDATAFFLLFQQAPQEYGLKEEFPDISFVRAFISSIASDIQVRKVYYNMFVKIFFSAPLYYPNDPMFGENAGQSTKYPLYFFQNLKKIDAHWYLHIGNAELPLEYLKTEVELRDRSNKVQIPCDPAYFLSKLGLFHTFCVDFENLSTQQQEALVEEAKWRSLYFGDYTYSKMKQDATTIFQKFKYTAMEYLVSPAKWLFEKNPALVIFLCRILVFVATVWMLRKISEAFNPQPVPTSKFMHRSQKPSNIVYHGRYTACETTPFRQCADRMLERHVREVTLSDRNRGIKLQGILTQQFLIINKHAFNIIQDEEFCLSIGMPGTEQGYKLILNKSNVVIDPDGDLALLFCTRMPATKGMEATFFSEKEFQNLEISSDVIFLSRTNGISEVEYHPVVRTVNDITLNENGTRMTINRAIVVSGNTMVGKSGSAVLIAQQNQPKLLGIQAWQINAIMSPEIVIQPITLEKFESLKNKVIEQVKVKPILRLAEYESTECEITGAFTSKEVNQVYAQVPEVVGIVGKTQFTRSPIANRLDLINRTSLRCPAALDQYDPRLFHKGSIHPLTNSLTKYFRGEVEAYSPKLLNYIESGMTQWIKASLDKTSFRKVQFDEIVTGTREDGSNPMNLSSSPGIPFVFQQRAQKGKKDYLHINELGDLDYAEPEFVKGYGKFRQTLMRGELPLTRSYDFPKDELRPITKALGSEITPPKTRTVTCMNVYYTMLWRELLLDFWSAMHRAADGTFPFCPGMNPEGPDWSNAYYYLSALPNAVDFDVSNWDGFLSAALLYKALDIICAVCNYKENSPEKLALRAILFEVMNSYIQYGNLIYQKHRGMLSGFPGTAEMNSICHWILILYIYLLLTQDYPQYHTIEAFRHHLRSLIYGDDIIITFSDEIFSIVNGETLARTYESIGYPVTSASKDSKIVKSKALLECQFLKSSWKELIPGYYIRTLDMNIAYDLLYWIRAKQHPVQQFRENLIDALRIAFGHGPETFNSFVSEINQCLREEKLTPILYVYEDLAEDYFDRYNLDFGYVLKY